jgi:hypothetical protein
MSGVLGFDSSGGGLGIFLFTTASGMVLGPTQPPIQWVPGALPLKVKRQVREADNSSPSSAEVKECVELYLHSPDTPSWRGAKLKHRDNTFTKGYYLKSCLSLKLSKITRLLMEPGGSSSCSQNPATGRYSELGESSSPHRSLSP